MARIISLIKREFKITIRNYYLFIILAVALILVAVIRFVIPAEMNFEKTLFLTSSPQAEKLLSDTNYNVMKENGNFLQNREDIVVAMEDDYNSIGLALSEKNGEVHIELITQGYENEEIINLAIVDIQYYLGNINVSDDYDVNVLFEGTSLAEVPDNLSVVPLPIMLESALMGLFLIAVMLTLEKDHKTIKAYVTTPGRVHEMLIAKVITMLFYAFISASVIVGLTIGLKGNWAQMLILVGLTSLWSSSLGIVIANMCKSLTSAMMPLVIVSLVLAAPVMSYFAPMFAPNYLRALPTYSLMLGLREALFIESSNALFIQALNYSLVLTVIFMLLMVITSKYAVKNS
jgi:hypothetical protein